MDINYTDVGKLLIVHWLHIVVKQDILVYHFCVKRVV